MTTVRKKYKDTLFVKLFGEEANKTNLLSLYNALNHTEYSDESELEINTIDDAIYMGMKNDVSCIVNHYMVLGEHQSTDNPNMPVRGLMYFGKLYDKYIKQHRLNLYSSKLLKLPSPKYYVFYNGNTDRPDVTKLRLSDAFIHDDEDGEFEWTATVLNINDGHNEELLKACSILHEYAIFVGKIKNSIRNGAKVEAAVNLAVDECIKENVLKEYLTAHKAEVIGMCITEYDEEETIQAFREEAREDGRKEGRKEGKTQEYEESLKSLVRILKHVTDNFETLYQMIKKDEKYADVTEEHIKKYY